jgi:glycosyltransferase involved in cell wall biosynthesis
LGINYSVVFEEWVPVEMLYSYYKTANLFLVTSLFEGYGMTLIEANAAHCKTVSTDVGVAREVGARVVEDKPEMIAEAVVNELR